MRRRALLATIPVALAGCTASPGGSTDTTTTATTSSDGTPTTSPTTGDGDAAYRVTDFSVSTTKVEPTHRYLVRITKVYSADAVEGEPGDPTVVDVSEVEDPEVRRFLKDVLDAGKVRVDAIPDGLRETTERVDFFTWDATTSPDDTASHWGVEVFEADPDGEPAIQFDASLTDDAVSSDDPGAITFGIENVAAQPWEVFSGTVPPFGMVWADGPADDRYLLWRDYEDEGCVNFTDDGEVVTCAIGKITPVEPGQRIEKRYGLKLENPVGTTLRPGEYVVTGTVNQHRDSLGPTTVVEWTVSFRVEDA